MGNLGRKSAILGLPPLVYASVFREIPFQFSRGQFLQWYGVFVYLCCGWVLWEEYMFSFGVHERKSPLLDTLLLVASSLGLRNFTATATTDLYKAFWGMDVFLGSACAWQVYTMLSNNYFEGSGGWISWIRPVKVGLQASTPLFSTSWMLRNRRSPKGRTKRRARRSN